MDVAACVDGNNPPHVIWLGMVGYVFAHCRWCIGSTAPDATYAPFELYKFTLACCLRGSGT